MKTPFHLCKIGSVPPAGKQRLLAPLGWYIFKILKETESCYEKQCNDKFSPTKVVLVIIFQVLDDFFQDAFCRDNIKTKKCNGCVKGL